MTPTLSSPPNINLPKKAKGSAVIKNIIRFDNLKKTRGCHKTIFVQLIIPKFETLKRLIKFKKNEKQNKDCH